MITFDDLCAALYLPEFDPVPAQLRMVPASRRMVPPEGVTPRQAGVLVLIYPESHHLHIVLTRRTEALRSHSGQISFPGGRRSPEDDSFTATALRETCEELGLCDPDIRILGMLSRLYIPPSNFEVFPTVAALDGPPRFAPNPDEVAEVFSLSLDHLLDSRIKQTEERDFQGLRVTVPYYAVRGHKVWGATAAMLSELENRLRAVLDEVSSPSDLLS